MRIRKEQPGDGPTVRDVHLKAFGDHGRLVADLVETLRPTITPADGLSVVAEDAGQVIGHVMFTRGLLDAPRRLVGVQVLSPVAVVPEHQKQGVGSAMIRQGIETMTARAVPVVFVEGPPGYYSRYGFEPGGELGFRKPSLRIPDVAFQALRLPKYEPWMTGTLVYSEPFWRHDAVGLRDVPPDVIPRRQATAQRRKVAAYAVCHREGRVLLARSVSRDGTKRHWTLPGGKVDHDEDPYDAVVREVAEETGFDVDVERLLGVDSRSHHVDWGIPGGAELQSIGTFYGVRITGGELRHEVGGSTDLAAWIPLADVSGLERAVIVDIGLELDRARPLDGHVEPVPVGGLLRH